MSPASSAATICRMVGARLRAHRASTGTAWRPAWCAPSGRAACRPAACGPGTRPGRRGSRRAGRRASAHRRSSMACCSSAMCWRSRRITDCSGRPSASSGALRSRPVSTARRAAKASRASAIDGSTTYQPLRERTSTKPRACNCISASRTSVRLTPNRSARSCSPRRSPGRELLRQDGLDHPLCDFDLAGHGADSSLALRRAAGTRLDRRRRHRPRWPAPGGRRAPHARARGRCRLPRRRSATVATQLPIRLPSARAMPMNQSTDSTSTRPIAGIAGMACSVAASTTMAEPGTPCAPLRGDQRDRQDRQQVGHRDRRVRGLRDEHRRQRDVDRERVEVERVAGGDDQADGASRGCPCA